MPDRARINHGDFNQPSQARISNSYSKPIELADNPAKDGYGPIPERFDEEFELTHPAPDLDTLFETTHLAAQLHAFNRRRQAGNWPHPNDGTTLYDVAVLDVITDFLNEYDISPVPLDMPSRRFYVAVLKKARKPAKHQSFVEYLQTADHVLAELGYPDTDALPGYETLRVAAADTLPEELTDDERDQLDEAVVRAIYAVYRNGIVVPTTVATTFGFGAVSQPLSERDVPRAREQLALQNWVRYLMDNTLGELSFDRTNPQTSFRQYIGLFAASALYNCGIQEVANISDYTYPRKLIPGGSGVGKYIRDDDLPLNDDRAALTDSERRPITAQFDDVHCATLDIADDMGFFEKPVSVAVDLYRIDWDGKETDRTINRPAKSDNDVRSQWTYGVFGVIDTDARFTLGARWLPEKSAYPRVVQSLAPIADEFLDVQALYADKELVSGALIDSFHQIADDNWITRAPEQPTVKKLKKHTPKNHVGYIPSVSWNTPHQSTLVAYPYNSSNPSMLEFNAKELHQADETDFDKQSSILEFSASNSSSTREPDPLKPSVADSDAVDGVGDTQTHAAYLTGRTVPDRSPAGIHFNYYQRWAIEDAIDAISNNFMPVVHANNEKLRLYGVNLAILFQNWHTLINRALSPDLGLPRHATHQEVLRAIEAVAFTEPE